MRPEDFLSIVGGGGSQQGAFRIGTIPADYTGGRPKVIFDGETVASTRTWTYLSTYTPVANDRVLVAMVGNGCVVIGKIL